MKRLSWKYMAGLIDGEGCFDFQCHVDKRNKVERLYIVPRLRIGMTEVSKDLLETIHANYNGNLTLMVNDNPNWGNKLTWQVQGKMMRPLLQNIVNHLILKKEQARLCIWWIDHMMGKSVIGDGKIGPARQAAKSEISAMKSDPHRLSEKAIENIKFVFSGCDSQNSEP